MTAAAEKVLEEIKTLAPADLRTARQCLSAVLLTLLQMGLLLVGAFLFGCLLVVLGMASYLWLEEPKRLAMDKTPFAIIEPQPLEVSPAATNVVIMDPPDEAYINGAATNAAVWANGRPYKTGGRAAWELARTAWPLWLLGPGSIICGLLLKRRIQGGVLEPAATGVCRNGFNVPG